MTLFKKTGEEVCKVEELKTLAEKSKGLIGASVPSGAYFRTRWGIHTFGVKFPIDIVIADEALRVRTVKKNLQPGRFFFWDPRFQDVFELPAGTIDGVRLVVGDTLELRQ